LKFKLALGEVDAVKRIREEKKITGASANAIAAATAAGKLAGELIGRAFESR